MSFFVIYAAALALFIPLVWSQQPYECPDCGAALPYRRKADSLRQTLFGGWTCKQCGAELDRAGHRIPSKA